MNNKGCKLQDARGTAFSILMQIEDQRSNSSQLLAEALEGIADIRERRLVTELVLGVLRWRGRLLFLISAFSKRPPERLDPGVRVILMLGAYQLVYTRIRPHAAIHETVKLCRRAKVTSATSFVNGVLRSLQQRSASLPEPQGDPVDVLSQKLSHPQWLISRWAKRFGIEQCTNILVENNCPPAVFVRVNPLRLDAVAVCRHLAEQKIRVEPTSFGPEVFAVKSGVAHLTQSFAGGEFYIQDPASEILGQIMAPKLGWRVLEIAAAPGGKTVQLAIRMRDQGLIVSVDSDLARMRRWKENMQRLGIHVAHAVVADGQALPILTGFDLVVVDAPCSNLGVVRRHPEIKWWRKSEDLLEFGRVQLQILEACAKYVRDQGEMIYSVCSFEPEETIEVKERFLAAHTEFTEVQHVFLFPHIHGTDGFFIAKFRKQQVMRAT